MIDENGNIISYLVRVDTQGNYIVYRKVNGSLEGIVEQGVLDAAKKEELITKYNLTKYED